MSLGYKEKFLVFSLYRVQDVHITFITYFSLIHLTRLVDPCIKVYYVSLMVGWGVTMTNYSKSLQSSSDQSQNPLAYCNTRIAQIHIKQMLVR